MSDPPRRRRVWLRRVARAVAAALLVWLLASYAVAYRLTRRARPPYEEPAPAGVESLRLTTADGEYGQALISRWPMANTEIHDLSFPEREPRRAICTDIQTPGGPLRVSTASTR